MKRRVLLDTNVWSYVVGSGKQGDLLNVTRSGRVEVQIAPGVLYETLRIPDVGLMTAIVRLQTKHHFRRLMPEAYSESQEILHAIARHRPEWLRVAPDTTFHNRLKLDWSRRMGGFWVRCEKSPVQEAAYLRQAEGRLIDASRTEAKLRREEMRQGGWKANPPMDKTMGRPLQPTPGWNGEEVQAWRLETWQGLTFNLGQFGNPYRDWICPFLETDTGLLQSAAWTEFWLHVVEAAEVPRQWLRWAHTFAQRFRKVSPGSGGDTQLFSYLPETDLVITADKALLDILEEVRPYSPRPLPKGQLIPAGNPGVCELLRILSGTHSASRQMQ